MIPAHLTRYPWYAPHLAWLATQGHTTEHVPPKGTSPVRADLSYADLSDATLSDADLSGAYLAGADLTGADLARAELIGANLVEAYLSDANLSDANLSDADLTEADLSDANLSDANLTGADLTGARGIIAVGPVGEMRRIIYGVAHAGEPMVHDRYWWGTLDATRARVAAHYADGTGREHHRAAYLAALDVISAALGGGA